MRVVGRDGQGGGAYRVREGHILSPGVEKAQNIMRQLSIAELDTLDGVEALGHVGLHGVWVAGLRHDLQ